MSMSAVYSNQIYGFSYETIGGKKLTFPFRFSLQEMHFYTILPKVFNHPSRSMNSAAPITSTVTGV